MLYLVAGVEALVRVAEFTLRASSSQSSGILLRRSLGPIPRTQQSRRYHQSQGIWVRPSRTFHSYRDMSQRKRVIPDTNFGTREPARSQNRDLIRVGVVFTKKKKYRIPNTRNHPHLLSFPKCCWHNLTNSSWLTPPAPATTIRQAL